MKKYISIDIGGTAIKYGIICENAEIILKETLRTEAWKGGPAILKKVIGIVEHLIEQTKGKDFGYLHFYCRNGRYKKRFYFLFSTTDS